MGLLSSDSAPIEYGDIVRLWISRILIPLGGYKNLLEKNGYANDRLAAEMGLKGVLDDDEYDLFEEFNPKQALKELRENHQKLEAKAKQCRLPSELEANIKRLSRVIPLSEVDKKVLAFAVLVYNEELLNEAAELLGNVSYNRICHAVSVIIGVPAGKVTAALSGSGLLARSGLVFLDHAFSGAMRGKLEVLSRSFAARMLMPATDPLSIMRDTIASCDKPSLGRSDYRHIQKSLDVLFPYLTGAYRDKTPGVNILVYGPPGTGKSQLARVVAKELKLDLYEISREDNDGDPIGSTLRLKAFRAAQSIFTGKKCLLMFDEVEDIFDDGSPLFGVKSTASKHKGWLNRMLEESPVPTVWLSNSVSCMDPAFVRRFDLVIELTVPPQRQRETIAQDLCKEIVHPTAVSRIAASEDVTPALIARASKVVRAIKEELPEEKRVTALEHLVETTLVAQGHAPLKPHSAYRLPSYYEPAAVNADIDLVTLADNLMQSRSGRLCIYGPPGTGKTAYGRWLADRLEIPLHIKRASDLISMYVGQTEQNIARAFRDAEQEGALLMVDEVDSFLQDRRKAQRSWEVTAVNEMLTQMEGYSGVFIASTNLMEGLDQAALRRFDIKTKFGYLKPVQAWALFVRLCDSLGLDIGTDCQQSLDRLAFLTPGDFAVIARRHRFQPFPDAASVIRVLDEECLLKEDAKPSRSIGFI